MHTPPLENALRPFLPSNSVIIWIMTEIFYLRAACLNLRTKRSPDDQGKNDQKPPGEAQDNACNSLPIAQSVWELLCRFQTYKTIDNSECSCDESCKADQCKERE